jgi:hypothetical protein
VVEQDGTPGNGSHVLQVIRSGSGGGNSKVLVSPIGDLDAGNSFYNNASVYHGIQFWVKGNRRGRMSVEINTPYTIPTTSGGLCDGESYECLNAYRCRVGVKEDWTLIRLPFARFLQSGFPNDGPLEPGILKVIGLSVRFRSATKFWFDDLSFYIDE